MYKFGVRYYDPSLGRWTQQDPVAGSLGDLNAANRYTYANDDPVNVVDPGGKLPCFLAGILVLIVVGIFVLGVLAPPLDLVGLLIFAGGGFSASDYAFDTY